MSRKRRQRNNSSRRKKAHLAQEQLVKISLQDSPHTDEFKHALGKQIWHLGTRHRIGLPSEVKHWICRGCKTLFSPASNARVRIRNGVRVTTCLNCGETRRFGGGERNE